MAQTFHTKLNNSYRNVRKQAMSRTDYCEMCGNLKSVKPVLIDDNFETYLCTTDLKSLRTSGAIVEVLKG